MHTISLYKRYVVVAALTMIAIAALSFALEIFADISIGQGANVAAAIVPAMDAGQAYAKRWEKRPENGYAWKVSAVFVVLSFVVSMVLAAILLFATGTMGAFMAMLQSVGIVVIAIIAVVVFVIYWLVSRFFFGLGAKSQIKAEARLAAKKEP